MAGTAEDEDAVQANQQAKKSLVDALDEALRQDPAADLTALFEDQARAYAVARQSLTTPTPPSDSGSDGGTDGPDFLLDDNNNIRVDRGIDARILDLVWPDIQHDKALTALSFPTEDGLTEKQFAAGLNTVLRNGQVLWTLFDTAVVGLGPGVVVKIGSSLDEDGITNLEYIKENIPCIPIPAVLGAFTCGRRTYVFMTRGRGVTLEALWPDLSVSDKRDVQDQLNQIFRDLRASLRATRTPEPRTHIGSFVSAVCKDTRRDQRVSSSVLREDVFNDFLVTAPPRRSTPAHIRMLRPAMRDDHAIVMTHADLHPRNIMAEWTDVGKRKRCRCVVTCILDWEMAGWYPAYWEYVKAMCNAAPRGPLADWPEYMPTDAIGTWPVEYALDSLIGRWLG